jgi:hypothetical protein
MAIEVESQRYKFRPRGMKTKLEFHYNPLHDLESVWWLAVWFIFSHVLQETPRVRDPTTASNQLRQVKLLFPRHLAATSRSDQFEVATTFELACSSLPSSFRNAATRLEDARMALVDRYERAERGDEIDTEVFLGIHEELIRLFDEAKDSTRDMALEPLVSLFTETHKRPLEEDTAEHPDPKRSRV